MKNIIKNHFVILVVVVSIAFWQIAFLKHVLLWDTINASFPFRYYIVECLRNGFLPLWLPYQYTGYPFFADPQSGCWYPVTWLVSTFGKYSLDFLDIEYMLSILIGGTGMYQLTKVWTNDRAAAIFGGMCYACCGVFVSNAEHFTWIISIAWLPWLFWAYYQMTSRLDVKYAAIFAVFIFLMASGGYPAFLMIVFYLIILIFISLLFQEKYRKHLRYLLKLNIILILLSLGCCAIVFYSSIVGIQASTRSGGVNLAGALLYPFSPACFISFLLPFSSIKGAILNDIDISMTNGYFGIIAFVFLILSFLQVKDKKYWLVLSLSLLCLMAAVGDALPFRCFLYNYIPLMNLFRFPSIFRIFFIIGFLLLASASFKTLKNDFLIWKKHIIIIIVIMLSFFIIAFISSLQNITINEIDWHNFMFYPFIFLAHSLYWQHIFIQSSIQILILLAFACIIFFGRKPKLNFKLILLLCAIDMVVSVQLNVFGTVANSITIKESQPNLDKCPSGFPLPDHNVPVCLFIDENFKKEMQPLDGNILLFKKVLGINGYNAFFLKSFTQFKDSKIKDSAWNNPPAYFANSASSLSDTNYLANKNDVYLNDTDLYKIRSQITPCDSSDSLYFWSFGPNKMTIKTRTSGTRLLVLQQNNFKDWQVTVDGQHKEWYKTNIAYMGVVVPTGNHKVTFEFKPKNLFFIFIFSLSCLLICFLIIAYKTNLIRRIQIFMHSVPVLNKIKYNDPKFIFWLLLIVSIMPIWMFSNFLTADGPCHVYNAAILNKFLRHDSIPFLSHFYKLNKSLSPNWFSHALLVGLLQVFAPVIAGKIVMTGCILLFALGFRYFINSFPEKSGYMVYWIFPFLWQMAMFMGFYNYMYSLGMYFLICGYWFRHKEDLSFFKLIFLSIGCVLLYFMHILGLVLICITIGLLTLFQIVKSPKSEIKYSILQGIKFLLVVLPSLYLSYEYIIHSPPGNNEGKLDIHYLFQNLRRLHSLQSITIFDGTLARWVARTLFALFCFSIVKFCFIKQKTKEAIVLIILIAGSICVYFFSYETFLGGSYLRPRLESLIYIFMILFISTLELPRFLKGVSIIISITLSILFLFNRLPTFARINNVVEEFTSLSGKIKDNSVVLPLDYQLFLKDSKGVMANEVLLFAHVAESIDQKKNIIYLENYEAATNYFPLQWQNEMNPFVHLSRGKGYETEPPDADIEKYNNNTVPIDYIVVWGRDEYLANNDSLTLKLAATIDKFYEVIYTTPINHILLYKTR